jgi:pimeloyl-ACP methyl ester carboxylesterase
LQYKVYGKQNKDVIVLLHGGGLSWWNYREISELLQNDLQIIIPILDGHTGSDKDFTSIKDNADEIISFIDRNFGGSVLLIGGLSLGGQILVEMLSQRKNICRYAIVESASVIPSKLTYSLIRPTFGTCYGLIKQKWFSKLQFRSLRIKPELFDDYYQDTCGITKQNMIAFLQESSMYSMKKLLVSVQRRFICLLESGKINVSYFLQKRSEK